VHAESRGDLVVMCVDDAIGVDLVAEVDVTNASPTA
jgi:hypothetical protein